ncbi:MAG: type I DNA topoisomerase, partial [Acholeplasmataceae bacterium]|nr:type I DNA topoisomerase [Acholeplasmataceae bacterium]
MQKKLIIVESPSKSKTIRSYVGNDVVVLSSKGHIRDLATSGVDGLGLDIQNGFTPQYKIIPGKQQVVKDLIMKSKNRDVLIATDPDREGEAIGWHLAQLLNLDPEKSNRIVFREITKQAILEALNHPRPIDQNLVNSQEVRRILDRIIGFKLSKLLQTKIKSKSAGRVQSVALKLIVDLEKEIQAFIPEIYFEIEAHFAHCKADYVIPSNEKLSKSQAEHIVKTSQNPFKVISIDVKDSKRQPKQAFITSTLQQDAVQSLGMSASRTMMVAQSLYEGKQINGDIIGLITYMRTDSTRLSEGFIQEAQQHIETTYGKQFLGRYHSTKKENTQDAHEAIRPTSLELTPDHIADYLSRDELKLYKRIYQRAIASLMAPAVFEITKVRLESNDNKYQLEGSKEIFAGHLAAFTESKTKDRLLPHLEIDQLLHAKDVVSVEKVTTPPARYSEATLIKEMESLGIGRPSTYAQIIQTLKQRDYVELVEKKFKPTDQGVLTTEQLDLFFHRIIEVNYTSRMENVLDEIAEGKQDGVELISKFYNYFIPMVETAKKEMKKIGPKMTEERCPKCGKPLVIRQSKYGEFIACSGFPSCKYVK